VHVPLKAEAAHPRVERLVPLREVDAGATVAEVLEALEALGARPQRLADGVVAPRLVQLHLGQPLPRLADAAREEEARHWERAVAHEPVPDLVPGVEDVDRPDLVLRSVVPAVPEDIPDLFRRRVDVDRERVFLHGREGTVAGDGR